MEFEVKFIEWLQSGANDFWNFFFKSISSLGTYVAIIAFFIVLAFICRKRFLLLGGCLGVGLIVNIILKNIVKRARPYVACETITQLGAGSGYSFPSSHAVCVTILAIFLCYMVFHKKAKPLTKALTIIVSALSIMLVCLSRMYLGLHYLTDVAAGVAVGAVITIVAILIYEKWIDKWLSKYKFFQPKNKEENK